VAGGPPISCDVRSVGADVSAARRELFPSKESKVLTELISADVREDRNTAAARVESADECLKNACVSAEAGLRLLCSTADGWVLLTTGHSNVATFVTSIQGVGPRLVFA